MSKNPHTPLHFYQQSFEFGKEIIVDGFAGGGGASTGIEMALGVSPDIAINHDYEAIALHMANHPKTHHYISDIFEVDPLITTMGRPVGYAHFSPDCKHFSKAKGGKPKDKKIRSLAWVAVKWAKKVRPRVITLENVNEFQEWGPIDKNGKVIESKKGETFKKFIQEFNKLGYAVEFKELKACDFGAPTTRKRFFMIARCDGQPIVWPEPTHGDVKSEEVKQGKLMPYRTAADIIDWSLPTYSIFLSKEEGKKYGVRRPLSDKTMERIARGFQKFVLESPEPYIVKNMNKNVPKFISEPLSTILTGNHHYLTIPFVSTYYGKTQNTQARGQEISKPLATITAGGLRHGLAVPYIAKHYTGATGFKMNEPMHTVTTQDHHSLMVPHIMAIDHTSSKNSSWDIEAPLTTITAKARHGVVAAFFHKYYGVEERQRITDPLHTIRTKDCFGLVEIKGTEYVLQDIGFRMLTPRELYNAQGFPENYKIDIVMPNGKTLNKASQVRMCGNSVVPQVIAAIVKANYQVQTVENSKVA
jgi:DNA (cytosine-5)-methyltransferase 1